MVAVNLPFKRENRFDIHVGYGYQHDLLIAAHSLSLDRTLITNNEREFKRVEGLKLDNWAVDG